MTAPAHRLRRSDDFRLTSRTGARAARSHVVVHVAVPPAGSAQQKEPRVGFVVSKKVGNSVVRHRVKRRLREILRPRMCLLPEGATCVVRALPGIQQLSFAELTDQVVGACQSAVARVNKHRAPKPDAKLPAAGLGEPR